MKGPGTWFVYLFLCYALVSVRAQNQSFTAYQQTIPGTDMSIKMVPIPAGRFSIGSEKSEAGRKEDEGPRVEIFIDTFWMGAFEISFDQFEVFLHDTRVSQNIAADAITRPSPQYIDFSGGMGKQGGFPANAMSQKTALMYCRWLYQNTGIFYRLPSEAEWEYACRAGTTTPYFFGSDEKLLQEYAWFEKNSGNVYHKTGEKKPNPWGLHDILGNVLEWTLDHYLPDAYNQRNDNSPIPQYKKNTYPKVLRGGSFDQPASELRSASRHHSSPEWNRRDPQIPKSRWWLTEGKTIGFRIVRPATALSQTEIEQFFDTWIK